MDRFSQGAWSCARWQPRLGYQGQEVWASVPGAPRVALLARDFQTWNSEADRAQLHRDNSTQVATCCNNQMSRLFRFVSFLHFERTQMTRISPPYSLPVHLPCLSSFLGPSLSLIMSKQVTSCNVACWYVDFKNVTSPSFKMSCICMSTTLLGLEVPSALLSANLALGTPTVLELLFQPRGSFKLTLRTLFLQESCPKTAAYWDVCCASSTPVVVDSLRKSSEIGFAWGGEQQICYRMPAARVLVSKESNTSSKGRLSGGQLWKSDLKPTLWTVRNFRKSAIATYCHSSSWLQLDQIVPCSLEELISSRNEALQIHHMRHDVPCEIHTAWQKELNRPCSMLFGTVAMLWCLHLKVDPKWCPKARCQAPGLHWVLMLLLIYCHTGNTSGLTRWEIVLWYQSFSCQRLFLT